MLQDVGGGQIYNLRQGAAITTPELVTPVPPDDESFLNDSDVVRRARDLAGKAHEGEIRRIRGEPFISHPIAVARIASEYEPTDFVQAVSLLHDIRDQPRARERISLPELRQTVGFEISFAVVSLSKVLQPTWTEEDIKQQYIDMAKQETEPEIQLVRAADKIHNLESAIEELHLVQDAFWRHFKGGRSAYLQWPADVLDAIVESGALSGHEILTRYEATIERFYRVADDQAPEDT